MAIEMFYEKKIGSLRALMREVGVMDADAGIRVLGRYGGDSCYCFVTRFHGTYTAMIYRRSRRSAPGRLVSSLEFKSIQQLQLLLREVAGSRVRAYAY